MIKGVAWMALMVGLASIVRWELREQPESAGAVSAPMRSAPPWPGSPRNVTFPGPAGGWEATTLDRPLFSPDRHPPSPPAAMLAVPTALPRLSGVMVSGADRSAILVPAEGGKAVVAREGSQVGSLTVKTISAGEVRLAGPDGVTILHPAFDTSLVPPTGPIMRGLPGFPGFAPPGLPGNPPAPPAGEFAR